MTNILYLNKIIPIFCEDDDEWDDYDFESYNTPCGCSDDEDDEDDD